MDSKQLSLTNTASELNPHHFFSKSLSFAELGVTSDRDLETNEVTDEINTLASTDLNCNLHSSTDGAFITSVWERGTNCDESIDRQLSDTYPFKTDMSPPCHITIGKGSSPEYHLNNINCNINRFLISGTSTKQKKSLSPGSDSLSMREHTTKKDSPRTSWSGSPVVNSVEKRVCNKTPSRHKGLQCEGTHETGLPSQGSATSTLSQSYRAICGTMTSNSTGSPSSQVNPMANHAFTSVGGQKYSTATASAATSLPKPKSLSNFALCSTSPQVIDHQSWLLGSLPSERPYSSVWSRGIGQRDFGKNGIGRAAFSSSDGDSKGAKARWGADETRRPRKKNVCPPKTKENAPKDMKRRHQNPSSLNSVGTSIVPSEDVELQRPQAKQQKRVTSNPFADTKSTTSYYVSTQPANHSATPFSKIRSSSELPVKKVQGQNMSSRLDSFTQARAGRSNVKKEGLEDPELRRRLSSIKTQKPVGGESNDKHEQHNGKLGAQYKSSNHGRQTSKEFETNRGKIQRDKIEKPVKRVKKKIPKEVSPPPAQDMYCSTDSSCMGMSDLFIPIKSKHTGGVFSSLESSSCDDLEPSRSYILHHGTHSSVDSVLMPLANFAHNHVQQRSIMDSKMSLSAKSDTLVDAGGHGKYVEDGEEEEDWQRFYADSRRHPPENRLEESAVDKKPLRKRKKKTLNQSKRRTNSADCPIGAPSTRKQGSLLRATQFEAKASSPKRRVGQQSKSSSAKIVPGPNAKAKKNQATMSRAASSAVVGKLPEKKIPTTKTKFGYLKNPRPRRSSQPEKTKNPPLSNENQQPVPVVKRGPSYNSGKNLNTRSEKVGRKPVERSPSSSKLKTNADNYTVKRNALSATYSSSRKQIRSTKANDEERAYVETKRKEIRMASETRGTQAKVFTPVQIQPARTYACPIRDRTPSVAENSNPGTEVDGRRFDLAPRPTSPMKRGIGWRQSVPSVPMESPMTRKSTLSPSRAKVVQNRTVVAGPSSRGQETTGKTAPKKLKYASRTRPAESTSSYSATNDSSVLAKKSGSNLSNSTKLLDYTSSQERQDLAGGDQGASGSSGVGSSSFVSTKSLTTGRLEEFRAIWHRQNASQASSVASSRVYVSSNSYLIPLRNLAWNSSRDRPSFAEEPAKEAETNSQSIEYGIIFVMLIIQILLHYFVSSQ